MTILSTVLVAILLIWLIYRLPFFRLEALPRWASPLLFFVKLCFGFALWAVYTFYYTDRSTADIYKFYDDARYIHQAWQKDKTAFAGLMLGSEDTTLQHYTLPMKNWERNFNRSVPFNENRLMIRLNGLVMTVAGDNIYMTVLFFCCLSFIGCILLLKAFQYFISEEKRQWILLTMLFPSFLFWTSGGLKESVIMLAIGMLLYGFLFLKERGILAWILFAVGILLLLTIKYFLLLCLLPSLAGYYFWIEKQDFKAVAIKYVGVLIVSLIVVIAIAPLDKRVDFARIVSKKQKHAVYEAQYMNVGSYSDVPVVEPTIASVMSGLPVGLWNSLMKPYLWQSRNPMMLISAIENLVLLIFLIVATVYRDKKSKLNLNLIFFLLIAVLLYYALIGLLTPVLGNLVRYRVVLLPFVIFSGLTIANAFPSIADKQDK